MSSIITTQNGQTYQKPSTMKSVGAVVASGLASSLVMTPLILGGDKLINEMRNINKEVDTVFIKNKGKEALELSKLNEKGVKIINFNPKQIKSMDDCTAEAIEQITDAIIKGLMSKTPSKKPFNLETIINHIGIKSVKFGWNACFHPEKNSVLINYDKLGTSVFHELGHAMNFNHSKFWKGMQVLRMPAMLAALTFPTVAIFKRAKAPNEEPRNLWDKCTTFIKDNVGKLTTLAFVPVVAEELKASANGKKLAKQLLDEVNLKKVVKTNRIGASSYIANGILAGVGAFVGNKVRDAIAKPKPLPDYAQE